MTEEEKNEQNGAPEAEVEAPQDAEAPQEVEADAPQEAEAEEAAPEEAEAPAPEADAAAPAKAAEPEAPLGPKERRRRERSQHRGEARPPRDAAERARERAEARRKKAQERRAWRSRSRERRRAAASGPARTEPVAAEGRAAPRIRQGVVVSNRADKTITVRIDVTRQHRAYKKIVRSSSTLRAHDESNAAGIGDTVRIVEARPLSRSKRWRLVDVLERAR
jgi:small subunit ribosomal protein S17